MLQVGEDPKKAMFVLSWGPSCKIFAEVGKSATITESACAKWLGEVIMRPIVERLRATPVEPEVVSSTAAFANSLYVAAKREFDDIEQLSTTLKVLCAVAILLEEAQRHDMPGAMPKIAPSGLRSSIGVLEGVRTARTPLANALNFGELAKHMFKVVSQALVERSCDEAATARIQRLQADVDATAEAAEDEDFDKIKWWLTDLHASWKGWTPSTIEGNSGVVKNIFTKILTLFKQWQESAFEDIGSPDFAEVVSAALALLVNGDIAETAANESMSGTGDEAGDAIQSVVQQIPDLFNPALKAMKDLGETLQVAIKVEADFVEVLAKAGMVASEPVFVASPLATSLAQLAHALGVMLQGAACLRGTPKDYKELLAEWVTDYGDNDDTEGALCISAESPYLGKLAQATKAACVVEDLASGGEIQSFMVGVSEGFARIVQEVGASQLSAQLRAQSSRLIGAAWSAVHSGSRLGLIALCEPAVIRKVMGAITESGHTPDVMQLLLITPAAVSTISALGHDLLEVGMPPDDVRFDHQGPIDIAKKLLSLLGDEEVPHAA